MAKTSIIPYVGAKNAAVEKAGVDRKGGKCRSGKYGSENVCKTVRTENKIRIN